MGDMGYSGCYKQKTRESMGAAGKMDGCAMFWRRSKFRLAERFDVEFNNHARALVEQIAESKEHERTLLKRLLKDNIGMVAVLEVLLPSSSRSRGQEPMHVCVANTHLYSNKDFPDVKLWQCHVLLRELEYKCRDLPLVLCGDFNSIPASREYTELVRAASALGAADVPTKAPTYGFDETVLTAPSDRGAPSRPGMHFIEGGAKDGWVLSSLL